MLCVVCCVCSVVCLAPQSLKKNRRSTHTKKRQQNAGFNSNLNFKKSFLNLSTKNASFDINLKPKITLKSNKNDILILNGDMPAMSRMSKTSMKQKNNDVKIIIDTNKDGIKVNEIEIKENKNKEKEIIEFNSNDMENQKQTDAKVIHCFELCIFFMSQTIQ